MKSTAVLALVAALLAGCSHNADLPTEDAASEQKQEIAASASDHAVSGNGEGQDGSEGTAEDSELAPEQGDNIEDEEQAGKTVVSDRNVIGDSGDGEETEPEPEYIDESQYEGDEAILVKLINESIKAINIQDEELYWSLLSPKTPIGRMPPKYYSKVSVQLFGVAGDERTAEVFLQEPDDEYETFKLYVFTKENGEWKILDID